MKIKLEKFTANNSFMVKILDLLVILIKKRLKKQQ